MAGKHKRIQQHQPIRWKRKALLPQKQLEQLNLKREIIDRISRGHSMNKISRDLHLSTNTVQGIYWETIDSINADIQAHAPLLRAKAINEISATLDILRYQMEQGDTRAALAWGKTHDQLLKLLSLYPKEQQTQDKILIVNFPGQPRLEVHEQHDPQLPDTIQGRLADGKHLWDMIASSTDGDEEDT